MSIITGVSVIIPLYNKERHIQRAIYSVISQTYQCFEIIIINDGSTDDSVLKVNEIKDKRIRIINQGNLGVSAARNKGIVEAKYQLIAFLDADDQWESICLENFVRVAKIYPDAGMYGAAFTNYNVEGDLIYPNFKSVPVEVGIILNYFQTVLDGHPFCASSVAVRKEVFDELGGFTEGMHYGEDNYLWAKIALSYQIVYINKPLAIRNCDADNMVSKKYEIIDDFPLLDYVARLNKTISNKEYHYIKEYTYERYLSLARRSLLAGNKAQARLFLSKSRATKLFRSKYIRRLTASYLPDALFLFLENIWNITKGII